MKYKTRLVAGLMVCSLFAGVSMVSATIINDVGPTWRGDAGTTYQGWGFDNTNSPADLDIDQNTYGDPTATILGIDPPYGPPDFEPPKTYWIDNDNGHQGVWHLYNDTEDSIRFHIPNNPVDNDQKIIWFQMTFYASGPIGASPNFFIFPEETSVTQISKIPVDSNYYYHVTWEIILEPNPPEEWITLKPQDCTLYIDEVVIDTVCIPEPASIVMLVGTSGLIAFIRRRFII